MNYQKNKVKKIHFKTASKRIKFLGTDLTKEVKNLYSESCKTLMKETEVIERNGKASSCSWIRRLNIAKMAIQQKERNLQINAIPQFSSVAQSCPTLCDPMNCSTPGLPVHHQLLEFTQTHVHRVRDAIQPSHPGSSPSPPVPNPFQHQSVFQ